jgi:hypothetical protein
MVGIVDMCIESDTPVVLTIDEIDAASDSALFINFLSQLWDLFLYQREETFQSVILAGVRDIRNLKSHIRPEADSKGEKNSPWNIAEDFCIDMSFSPKDIETMLREYDDDHGLDLDIEGFSRLIYDYTSGYPFLVSCICKTIDKRIAFSPGFPDLKSAWTESGFLAAERLMRKVGSSLLQSLRHKVESFPDLKEFLRKLLFSGRKFEFTASDPAIESAAMLGFIKEGGDQMACVSNRIFETFLYDHFSHEYKTNYNDFYDDMGREKGLILPGGILDLDMLLEKFALHYKEAFPERMDAFLEEHARGIFVTYIKLLLNGSGSYHIEAQTRDQTKIDIVITYYGKRYLLELKIWRGKKYIADGEVQLAEYLECLNLDEGHLLVFSFLKRKDVKTNLIKSVVNGKTISKIIL